MAKKSPFDPLASARTNPTQVTSLVLNPAAFRNEGHNWAPCTSFPSEIFNCINLRQLEIFRGIDGSAKIPSEIGLLTKLEKLSLGGLSFRSLPETIGQLTQLKTLELNYNHNLTTLPDSIGQLKELEELRLAYTPLQILPDSIGKLSTLRTLILSNGLKKIPVELWNLTELRVLALPEDLTHLPTGIGALTKLESLTINATALTKIANELRTLTHVQELRIVGDSSLHGLPETIGDLHSLKKLQASCLCLKTLPASCMQLRKLEELNIADNQLTELIPFVRALPKLKILDFSANKISRREKRQIDELMRLPPSKRAMHKESTTRTSTRSLKAKPLGRVASINASLAMLVADAHVASVWQGTNNGKGEECKGSDWDRMRIALRQKDVASIMMNENKFFGLTLAQGCGLVDVFRVQDNLVMIEGGPDKKDCPKDDYKMFLEYVASKPNGKRVGEVTLDSGFLVLLPSTDACEDVLEKIRMIDSIPARSMECGSEDSGLLIATAPGVYTLVLENEVTLSWGSARRAMLVPVSCSTIPIEPS